jgi:hypothetical protein
MNQELEEQIRKTVDKNPDMQVLLNKKAEKFYFYSAGGWISESELLKRTYPNWLNKKKKQADLNHEIAAQQELKTHLMLLLATGKAVSKVEEDDVIRYKFTEKPDIHMKFLEQEEKHLLERLKWIREKKKYFHKTDTEK